MRLTSFIFCSSHEFQFDFPPPFPPLPSPSPAYKAHQTFILVCHNKSQFISGLCTVQLCTLPSPHTLCGTSCLCDFLPHVPNLDSKAIARIPWGKKEKETGLTMRPGQSLSGWLNKAATGLIQQADQHGTLDQPELLPGKQFNCSSLCCPMPSGTAQGVGQHSDG